MLLPSILGAFSTTAISVRSSAKSSSTCLLLAICAISLPRKRKVTFTLSPLERNFLAALTFVFRSLVSMFGERRTSLISIVFCFFLSFFFLTGKLITVFTVINNLAYRWFRLWCDLYKIKSGFLCLGHMPLWRKRFQAVLRPVRSDVLLCL